jgi:hypothetical protein
MDSETSCPNFDGFTIRVCSLVSRQSEFSAVPLYGQTNANDKTLPPDAKKLSLRHAVCYRDDKGRRRMEPDRGPELRFLWLHPAQQHHRRLGVIVRPGSLNGVRRKLVMN